MSSPTPPVSPRLLTLPQAAAALYSPERSWAFDLEVHVVDTSTTAAG